MNIPDEKFTEIAKAAQEIAATLMDIDTLAHIDSVEIYAEGIRRTLSSQHAVLCLGSTAETIRGWLMNDLETKKAEFYKLLEED